jgi:hypothetical protein
MRQHIIDTKFGPAEVRVHRLAGGWKAMLVGRHLVPYPPPLSGPLARSEDEAVAQLLTAVQTVELTY